MWDDLLGTFSIFTYFMITSLVSATALWCIWAFLSRKFSWNTRFRGIYGFFMARSGRECRYLAACFLQLTFLFSAASCRVEMAPAHLLFLSGLAVWKAAASRRPGMFLRDLANGMLIFAALLVENVLNSYLSETRFNLPVLIVLIAFAASLCLYGTAFFVRDVALCFGGFEAARLEKRRKRCKDKSRKLMNRLHLKKGGDAGCRSIN